MIKGIVFDYDDTLYSHAYKKTPTLVYRALKQLKQKGIKICLNTSRDIMESDTIDAEILKYIDFFVYTSGGFIKVNDNVSYTSFDNEIINNAVRFCHKNNIVYRITKNDGHYYYSSNVSNLKKEEAKFWTNNTIEYRDYIENEEVICFNFFCDDEKLFKQLEIIFKDSNFIKWSDQGQFTPFGIDKGIGVKKFKEYYGFSKDEVCAFGDGINDGSMFLECKYGVALKHASDECKKMANYICKKEINENAIYFALIDLGIIDCDINTVFFDVDSTSFDHSVSIVRDSTLIALKKLKEANININIATSRSNDETKMLPKKFRKLFNNIYTNGCRETNGIVYPYGTYIDDDVVKDILGYCDDHNIIYRYCSIDTSYLNNHSKYDDLFYRLYFMVPQIKKYDNEKVNHILLYPNTVDDTKEILKMMKKENCEILSHAIEIIPILNNKGSIVERHCKENNIDKFNVLSFGDSGNDISMFNNSGIGICVGNGTDNAKEGCDYVCDDISNEGIYQTLVDLKLIKED